MKKPKVLLLYTELSGYLICCLSELSKIANVALVYSESIAEAPFSFALPSEVNSCLRNNKNANELKQYAEEIKPNLIICAGWADKDYLKISKAFINQIPIVLTMDNHWKGTIKQYAAQFLFPLTVKKLFSKIWVPGNTQKKYAKKLGFSDSEIELGYYSADTNLFSSFFKNSKYLKKRFIYLGRYVPQKGINDLWEAFEIISDSYPDWELWCVGTGSEWENRKIHPRIRHLGFKQPNELKEVLDETTVYILPSHYEPWGVSVHEMAAAGFPMILSNKVGASELFLEEGKNGFTFKAGSKEELKELLIRFIEMNETDYNDMAIASHSISKRMSPFIWSKKIMSFLNK